MSKKVNTRHIYFDGSWVNTDPIEENSWPNEDKIICNDNTTDNSFSYGNGTALDWDTSEKITRTVFEDGRSQITGVDKPFTISFWAAPDNVSAGHEDFVYDNWGMIYARYGSIRDYSVPGPYNNTPGGEPISTARPEIAISHYQGSLEITLYSGEWGSGKPIPADIPYTAKHNGFSYLSNYDTDGHTTQLDSTASWQFPAGYGAGFKDANGNTIVDGQVLINYPEGYEEPPPNTPRIDDPRGNARNRGGGIALRRLNAEGELWTGTAVSSQDPREDIEQQWLDFSEANNKGEKVRFTDSRRAIKLTQNWQTPSSGGAVVDSRIFRESGKWVHVTITYTGTLTYTDQGLHDTLKSGQLKVYKNGVQVYGTANPDAFGSYSFESVNESLSPERDIPVNPRWTAERSYCSNFYLGMPHTKNKTTFGGVEPSEWAPRGQAQFKGKISDICRFNRVLTPAEVEEMYNGGSVKDMTQHSAYSSLTSWYKMGDDEDSNRTNGIRDYIGGYHGTPYGQSFTDLNTDLKTDRTAKDLDSNIIAQNRGLKARIKNLVGQNEAYIHNQQDDAVMPNENPTLVTDGYDAKGSKFLHLYWKAAAGDGVQHTITAYCFNHATGVWSEMKDIYGNDIVLSTENESINTYRIFEISSVDRIYFKQSGDALAPADIFSAANSE